MKHHPDVDPKSRDDHASKDGNKDKDGGEPKKRLRNGQGVQEARIPQPKPWRMPTRFNLQKAIGEQKMRKAIAAGLCKCPIETQRVRKTIATGLAERKKRNRGRRSAQSGEECGVAARAKSRKRWRRKGRGERG